MIARPHAWPSLSGVADLVTGGAYGRPAQVGPEVLADWTARFVARLAVPAAQHIRMSVAGGPMLDHVVDLATGSFATLVPDSEGGFLVSRGGPERLWDAVEQSIAVWRHEGAPPQTEFGLTITPARHQVWLGAPEGRTWDLPD